MRTKTIQHWITVAICCGLSASSIGICVNSLGVFFTSVSADLVVGRGAFALHATISNIVTGLFCPIGMRLLKKDTFRVVVSFGILLAGGATMLMAVGGNVWVFYLLGAIRGMGCSFFGLVVITFMIGNWFEAKHGFAVGLTLSFSGLSGAVFSPLFSYLITLIGWRLTYVVMGIVIIILALPGTVFLLNPYPAQKHLLPYGGGKAHDTAARSHEQAAASQTNFLSMSFIALTIFTILCSSITGIAQHFPGYAESLGSTATAGAAMVSAAMIGNILFKLLIGLLSDAIGPLNACGIMVAANTLALILLSVIKLTQNNAVTLSIAFMFGAIYAVGAVGISLMTRHVFGAERYASVYPYISLFIGIGSAASLSIIGFLYDVFRTYRISLIGGIAFGGINLVLLQLLKYGTRRQRESVARTLG